MNNKDPLENILVDETTKTDRAKQLLVSILQSRVEISEKSGKLEILPETYSLSTQNIVLVLLCGKLAQKLLGKLPSKENEMLSQQEIIQILSTIPQGSLKVALKRLRDAHYIGNKEKKNFVEFSQLQKIKEKLVKNNSNK